MSVTFPSPQFANRPIGDSGNYAATTFYVDRATNTINVLKCLTAGQPDGTTDNTAEIQAAINAAAAANATLVFPLTAHAYVVTCQSAVVVSAGGRAALLVPSNSHLVINGTIILKAGSLGGLRSGVIALSGVSNVILEGTGTIDGNKTNQTAQQNAVVVWSCSDIYIDGITAQNATLGGVNIFGTARALVDSVTILSNQFASQFALGCDRCWITDSYISGTNDYAWAFYDGVTNSGITGCVSAGNPGPGIGVLTDTAGTAFSDNILIEGNICAGNGTGIIVNVGGTSVGTGTHTNIKITANEVSDSVKDGISVFYTKGVTIDGNNVNDNNTGSPAGTAGIYVAGSTEDFAVIGNRSKHNLNGIAVYPSCSRGQISNNIICNSNNGGSGASAILVQSTSTDLVIQNNDIFDDQGSPTQGYGIASGDTNLGARITILYNRITNTIHSDYLFTAAADTVLVKIGASAANSVDFVTPVTVPTATPGDSSGAAASTAFVAGAVAGPGGSVKLYATGISVGNGADTTEDVLQTYTMAGGTLASVGDDIRITAGGTCGATTDSKTIRIRATTGSIASGVVLASQAAAAAGNTTWWLEAVLTVTGSGTQGYMSNTGCAGANPHPTSGTSALNTTLPIQIVVTGTNATNSVAGSISCQGMTVNLEKAA